MKDKKENVSGKDGAAHFLLVAIGAAAGGLEAITELLHRLPGNTGLVYLYLQSSDSPAESEIVTTLSAATTMPVLEARNRLEVRPDHVYVIPAEKEVALSDDIFRLTTPKDKGTLSLPVNRFFIHLADDYNGTIVGVLLSGETEDGAQGVRAIKMAGGIVFAQDESASFRRMPGNVVADGGVDLVLSVPEIAEELEKMGRQKEVYHAAIQHLDEGDIGNLDKALINILQLLYKFTGLDFSQYKTSTIKRRIIRRMMLFKLETLQDYLSYIQDNKNEINLLYQDLLINVTTFFRDAEMTKYLRKILLPRIIKSKGPNEPIRIWVPACSTGQEPYSLAMLLMEILGERAASTPVQIFATDISEASVNKARLGVYSKTDVQDIPARRLQRFFVKMDGNYRIVKNIRDLCIFATQNIFKDPPFSSLDLISCCNLLIYLDNNLQKKIIATFHYALNNDGYLVLGKSETVGAASYLFSQYDKKRKVYAKKKDTSGKSTAPQRSKPDETDLEKAADALLPDQDMQLVSARDKRVTQLEAEPNALREDMRSIVEAQEAANEELQSANEDIVSSNEELITINQELLIRNEQLTEVQEYAIAVFTTIRECLLILDKDLCVKAGNKAFYKTFRTREDLVEGRRIYELNNRQWDIPQLHTLLEQMEVEDAHREGFEITHHFPGIGEKVLLLNAHRIVQKIHRQELILLAIEDITRHRQAQRMLEEREAWFRNMADNAPVMIWVTGANKLCSFCNNTWLEFRGITLDTAIGKKWTAGVHADDIQRCEQQFNEAMAKKEPFIAEYRLLRSDGEYRWILTKARPGFNPEGEFTGYIGTGVDIHDQRTMNQELEKRVEQRTQALLEANMELERSNSELEQFAYVASHDLQEPLRKILTFIDRVQKGNMDALPAETKKYFAKINDASNRMIRLIDDLLNFSRISRLGKRYVKTDLNNIVQGILTDLDLRIAEKKAKITVDKLPVIQAIPLQMTQLFHNLLSNALKFTASGRAPVIQISCRLLSKEEGMAERLGPSLCYEISVKDNGIGFRQEYAEQIFTIFQRLHDRSEYSGTGIGLSLCRKIVSNHEGKIYASGEENEGAVFHILLPAKQQD